MPTPLGRLTETPRGREVFKTQFFKRKYDSKKIMEFPEGWEVQFKKSSMGGVWIYFLEQHILIQEQIKLWKGKAGTFR